jgi:hypothetical protein
MVPQQASANQSYFKTYNRPTTSSNKAANHLETIIKTRKSFKKYYNLHFIPKIGITLTKYIYVLLRCTKRSPALWTICDVKQKLGRFAVQSIACTNFL